MHEIVSIVKFRRLLKFRALMSTWSRYFLITVTPDTLDDAISYASQSGIGYITFLDNIWAGAGHYNVSKLWGGHPGLSAAVAKIKAAGLKAGIHTMSGNIVKTDAYVTPVPGAWVSLSTLQLLVQFVKLNATHSMDCCTGSQTLVLQRRQAVPAR